MIQVPRFGLENNRASLEGRRQAFAWSYGHGEPYQNVTEVVYDVPTTTYRARTAGQIELTLGTADQVTGDFPRLRMEFYHSWTPYVRSEVTLPRAECAAFAADMERSGHWQLVSVKGRP